MMKNNELNNKTPDTPKAEPTEQIWPELKKAAQKKGYKTSYQTGTRSFAFWKEKE